MLRRNSSLAIWSALFRCAFTLVDQRNDVAHFQRRGDEAGRHRGRHTQRLVLLDGIVPDEVERKRMVVVLDLL